MAKRTAKNKSSKKKATRKTSNGANRSNGSGSNKLGGPFDYENIENLLEVMKKHGVNHYEWESGDQRLALSAGGGPVASFSHIAAAAPAPAPSAPAPAPVTASNGSAGSPASNTELAANQKKITSPFVGTFYRSSSPGGDPFVSEGKVFKKGDTLCIVEAMKLMNEIEAEASGKIIKVLVDNEQPVEFGEELFVVEVMS